MYAKDKLSTQVEEPNDSTMNRISTSIPDPKLKFSKSISKFNYEMLMNPNVDFSINSENPVIKSYDYWNARINEFEEDKAIKNQDMYKYKKLRDKVQEETGRDLDYIVNTLVAYLYTVRKTSAKKGLWDGFGETILENLKVNLEGKGKICPICGKRFNPKRSTQNYCSDVCYAEGNRRATKERKFAQ